MLATRVQMPESSPLGPAFRGSTILTGFGQPGDRAQVNMEYPPSAYSKQSQYPVHPVAMDCLLHLTGYSIAQMQMNALDDINCVPTVLRGSLSPPGASRLPSRAWFSQKPISRTRAQVWHRQSLPTSWSLRPGGPNPGDANQAYSI